MKYFIDVPGYENQMLTRVECLQLINSGEIMPETQICAHDSQVWMPARSFFNFVSTPALKPEPEVKPEEKRQESPPSGNLTAYLLFVAALFQFILAILICASNSFSVLMILSVLVGSAFSALILIALAEIHTYTRKLASK